MASAYEDYPGTEQQRSPKLASAVATTAADPTLFHRPQRLPTSLGWGDLRGKAYPTHASIATRQCTVSYFLSVSAGMYLARLRGSRGLPMVSTSYPPIASSDAFAWPIQQHRKKRGSMLTLKGQHAS